MEMAVNILLLLVGFVLLIKGADFFVDGSSSVAKLLGVPAVVIGLTVVAMGTSAPEAAVSITAGISGSNEIAISNVVGSNIFNMLVVVGVCAAIKPFEMDRDIMKRDFPVNLAASAVLLIMILIGRKLDRIDSVIILVLMAAYLVWVVGAALKNRETTGEDVKKMSPLLSIVCIVGGLAAIIFGGNLVVENAKSIAYELGWSETFIGLTIIAIGTSLPELVTSIVAARKGESGLALGNVVGSNIFNIMFILGLSGTLAPIAVDAAGIINCIILFVMTLVMLIWCALSKKLNRVSGIIWVLGYVAYTAYLLYAV
ncbi:MAG: calcium/sodium antiporter [Clostridia bacterium]|nr:calcium/sodium antiporter [Clostridia bacterium]